MCEKNFTVRHVRNDCLSFVNSKIKIISSCWKSICGLGFALLFFGPKNAVRIQFLKHLEQ